MKLHLTPNEIKVIILSLDITIEDIEASSKDVSLPFNPATRKDMAEILRASKTVKDKFCKIIEFSGDFGITEISDDDINDLMTKES